MPRRSGQETSSVASSRGGAVIGAASVVCPAARRRALLVVPWGVGYVLFRGGLTRPRVRRRTAWGRADAGRPGRGGIGDHPETGPEARSGPRWESTTPGWR